MNEWCGEEINRLKRKAQDRGPVENVYMSKMTCIRSLSPWSNGRMDGGRAYLQGTYPEENFGCLGFEGFQCIGIYFYACLGFCNKNGFTSGAV